MYLNRNLLGSPKSGNTEETVKMAKKTSEELFSEIIELDKYELELLVTDLEKKLGVSVKEHTANEPYIYPDPDHEIILIECSPHNTEVIKLIREYTYCSLRDAKACLDVLPKTIRSYCSDDEAFIIKKRFEDAGAVVQLERVWS